MTDLTLNGLDRPLEGQGPLRIAVALKQVPPSLGGTTDPVKGFVLRTGPGRLNPSDGPALELALRLKDERPATVDLFSMGPPQTELTLREALSLGPDRAFHISDPLLSGSDSLATARALARAMEIGGAHDLIVCGLATADGGTGQVGPALASIMGIPFIGRVAEVLELEETALRVKQLYSDHSLEVRVEFPAVLTVLSEGFTMRLPSIKARLRLRLITRLTLADLTADRPREAALYGESGSPTRILRTLKPKPPDQILARPTPVTAASVIIEAARKAKS